MTAKTDLLSRIEYIESAINLPPLIDNGIGNSSHNSIANLLRKGLGIVSFNILEDFIKKRTVEAFQHISTSRVRFENLPEQLQSAATQGVLKALINRSALEKKNNGDWLGLIQKESNIIYSTSQGTYSISELSLLNDSSNIAPDDINTVMKCFGITGGWATLKRISDSFGGGILDLCEVYKNTSNRRHSSAHEANFQYQYSWLQNITNEIKSIAASFDIALSARCRQISKQPSKKVNEHQLDEVLNYRFLHKENGCYKEKKSFTGRSTKNWDDLEAAVDSLSPNLENKAEFLVVINENRRIENWYT